MLSWSSCPHLVIYGPWRRSSADLRKILSAFPENLQTSLLIAVDVCTGCILHMAPIKVWELCGAEKERVFSPFCWATRLAVIHKGLECETVPWWACPSLTSHSWSY